jgi:hypothetical protein
VNRYHGLDDRTGAQRSSFLGADRRLRYFFVSIDRRVVRCGRQKVETQFRNGRDRLAGLDISCQDEFCARVRKPLKCSASPIPGLFRSKSSTHPGKGGLPTFTFPPLFLPYFFKDCYGIGRRLRISCSTHCRGGTESESSYIHRAHWAGQPPLRHLVQSSHLVCQSVVSFLPSFPRSLKN